MYISCFIDVKDVQNNNSNSQTPSYEPEQDVFIENEADANTCKLFSSILFLQIIGSLNIIAAEGLQMNFIALFYPYYSWNMVEKAPGSYWGTVSTGNRIPCSEKG